MGYLNELVQFSLRLPRIEGVLSQLDALSNAGYLSRRQQSEGRIEQNGVSLWSFLAAQNFTGNGGIVIRSSPLKGSRRDSFHARFFRAKTVG